MPIMTTQPMRSSERVAVLMTPQEKAVFSQRARGLGLSLGQFFREAGEAYVGPSPALEDEPALLAALDQIERSTARAEQALDQALAMVRASNSAMDRGQTT